MGSIILFGISEAIDFLHLNCNSVAWVNANYWFWLVLIDESGVLLSQDTDILINTQTEEPKVLLRVVINQSANTASHEYCHNVKLHQFFLPFIVVLLAVASHQTIR